MGAARRAQGEFRERSLQLSYVQHVGARRTEPVACGLKFKFTFALPFSDDGE